MESGCPYLRTHHLNARSMPYQSPHHHDQLVVLAQWADLIRSFISSNVTVLMVDRYDRWHEEGCQADVRLSGLTDWYYLNDWPICRDTRANESRDAEKRLQESSHNAVQKQSIWLAQRCMRLRAGRSLHMAKWINMMRLLTRRRISIILHAWYTCRADMQGVDMQKA